jgi:hypothetical protein
MTSMRALEGTRLVMIISTAEILIHIHFLSVDEEDEYHVEDPDAAAVPQQNVVL